MNRLLCLVALVLAGSAPAGATSPDSAQGYTILNVHVLPMTGEEVLRDRAVVVENGRIVAILAADEVTSRTGRVIDGQGGYLLPGLADMHVHVRDDPSGTLDLFVANGVTTVMNMDALDGGLDHIALRDSLERGEIFGPRYFVTGPVTNPRSLPDLQSVPGWVAMHETRGYDFIKIHMDLDPPVYDRLMQLARERGIRCIGHMQRKRPLEDSLGLALIAHVEEFGYVLRMEMLDPAARRRAAEKVARAGTWVSPTLTIYAAILDYVSDSRFVRLADNPDLAYLPARERAVWLSPTENEYRNPPRDADFARRTTERLVLLREFVADLDAAGVPLLVGSDGFGEVVPGFSLHDEMRAMVEAGVPAERVLRAATAGAATFLGIADETGTIEVGKQADLILLASDPRENIGATETIRGVGLRGSWLPREELDRMLKRVRTRYDE